MLEWIDVNSFIDYFSSQMYCRNEDWPGNNIRYWKTNDATGKWRWIMYDTDFGMGIWGTSPTDNSLAFATATNGPNWPNPPWSTLLLRMVQVRVDPDGRIALGGATIAKGYRNPPEPDPFAEPGWFLTDDVGALDSSGILRVLGGLTTRSAPAG